MRAILHLFGGKDGRLSFGKLVVVAMLALIGVGHAPSDVLGAALLAYAYGRSRQAAKADA